ncbi:Leucine binding and solute-binding domains-containing protein [Desulfonema magnum]|uniref:Leucine binding and solute-binding domains-containing protein n=2 Tax=Desulfonema magnum TaxID=45655 RepID=A0A975BY69_9BACT|nr:Leucine binding and solute-binding domains-containing protein [Desulfonema magnum]
MVAIFFIASCKPPTIAERRAQKAANSKGDIVIGIVDSSPGIPLFVEGINFAIEELNGEGGILGRKIRAIYRDDEGSVEEGQKIARELGKNTNIIAVVGHCFSDVAIPVSITYEKSGLVFISPGTTNPDLIRSDNKFVFRNIPSDIVTGRELAKFAHRSGYKQIAVIYDRDSTGRRLAEVFYKHADDMGIKIAAEISYSGSWEKDFRLLIAELVKETKFDAVFLGGEIPSGAHFVKQMRKMGVTVPIIGGNSLDSPQLLNIAGKSAQNTILPTVFDPKRSRTLTREFVKKFKSKTGITPDRWAAQGYDAVRLLAFAIKSGDSTVPITLSTILRFLENWEGVTGSYSFTSDGNIIDKSVFFKMVDRGEFRFLERDLRKQENPFEILEEVTLRLPVEGIIPTIDPGLTSDVTSIELTEQLFLALTDFDPKTYEPVPEFATEWKASQNGKFYLFKLREDVTWTNGEPVTAHDVVWAIRRNIDPKTEAPFAHALYALKNARAIHKGKLKDISKIGVNAIDDFTLWFRLEHPVAYFPALVSLWIYRPLPRNTIEKYKDKWTEPKNIQTNGSYKLIAWEKGMAMALQKNQDYYDAKNVRIPKICYYVIPESSVGLAMYKNNQLDIIGDSYLRLPMAELPNILADPVLSAEYSQQPMFSTYAYAFSTNPPLDNVLVRKAIAAAINRKLIIAFITKGGERAAKTYVTPPAFGSVDPEDGVGINFNPAQAKKWLAEAGYPDGKGLPEIMLTYNDSETHREIARAIQIFLKYYLNITLKLDERNWSDYLESLSNPSELHMFRIGWSGDYPDASNWFDSLPHYFSFDKMAWGNSEFVKTVRLAEKEQSLLERKKLYMRAEQIMCEEDCVVTPIFFDIGKYLVKPRIKGWYNMALGGQHIRDWYFEQ